MAPVGNSSKIENTLYYHLGQLTLVPTRNIAWPDINYTPVEGEIFLEPSVLWNNTDLAEIGTGAADRYVGILTVGVKGPVVVDSLPEKEVADSVIAHYNRTVITRNSITVRIGSFVGGNNVPWRGASFTDNGWRIIPVSIPFWCDITP